MSGRYLAGAHLTERTDQDILPWVRQLSQEGRLSLAVKDGLRLVYFLCSLPGGENYQHRGILVEAVKLGLLRLPGPVSTAIPDLESHRAPIAVHTSDAAKRDLDQELDAMLGR